MTTIYADFNAQTEDRLIRLTPRGSEEDIRCLGVQVGDLVRLTDGEIQVDARIAEDPRYGWVGIPAWETRVDLEEVPESVPLPAEVDLHS